MRNLTSVNTPAPPQLRLVGLQEDAPAKNKDAESVLGDGLAELKLERPLVYFDLETTGTDVAKDRIVEIALLKQYPEGDHYTTTQRVNPEMPIPREASAVHGITDDQLIAKPTFKKIARRIDDFLRGCDLAGYNCINFDVPLLAEEFARVGIAFPRPGTRIVDAYRIFKHYQRRNLASALRHYTGESLVNAHQAQADTEATQKVLLAQVRSHGELGNTVGELHEFCQPPGWVDHAGKIIRNRDDEICFNFGKYRGQPIKEHLGMARWMLENEFPETTKSHVRRVIDEQRQIRLGEDNKSFS